MNASTKVKNYLKVSENYNLNVYDDGYGFLTVGWGHKVVTADNLKLGDSISAEQAITFFNNDIRSAESDVNSHPNSARFTQAQFDAICALVFNVGGKPATDPANDLYKALNKNTFIRSEVVKGFTYTIAGDKRNPGLIKRRNAELDMFFNTEGTVYIAMNIGDSITQIAVTAQLTIQGSNISVRDFPDTTNGEFLSNLSTGAKITATSRVLINEVPWFYISDYKWINGNYVMGWIKDYNDNNRWWYVKQGYKCPTSTWEPIAGKDYCFGKDGYLFVDCYIKSEVENKYYWVDDDGVWLPEWNTNVPDSGFRVVQNYKTENAYRG